MEVSVVHLK